MEADIVVAAFGAASLCRRAFPETFRSPDAPQSTDRTRLGDTDAALNPVEYALGVSLKDDPDPSKGRPQSQNVILTLSQNRFLLNSERGKRGFLNVRVTRTEYEELFAVAGKAGCEFGSPITLYSDFAEAAKGSAREGAPDANFQRSQTDALQSSRLFGTCTDVSIGLSSSHYLGYGL
ncbi:unnamed protein product [Symbiodinium pilosum]|uniref:Uncharacterized protein n=1 Tax=Symbiodinium pilosum TaxID=2952 RepID=A0A812WN45_SYMPI|nr:unnamed protein product [Symbiodinium pilosum]